MRTTHRSATTAKGWGSRAPKTVGERRALRARCGPRAFLDPEGLRFPVIAKRGRCLLDCQGLKAALGRAKARRYRSIVAKAESLLRRGCGV
jgi:hypothetical protein